VRTRVNRYRNESARSPSSACADRVYERRFCKLVAICKMGNDSGAKTWDAITAQRKNPPSPQRPNGLLVNLLPVSLSHRYEKHALAATNGKTNRASRSGPTSLAKRTLGLQVRIGREIGLLQQAQSGLNPSWASVPHFTSAFKNRRSRIAPQYLL
jgi:hypothetical protein